jgi:hypothetical protein
VRNHGYIALTTVLVILPLLLITGINSLYNNTTSLIVGKMNYDYQILRSNSETCLEEAVYKIKRGRTYTGTFNIAMDNWSCNVIVSNKVGSPGIKLIDISSSDTNSVQFKTTKELNINSEPFEISNT